MEAGNVALIVPKSDILVDVQIARVRRDVQCFTREDIEVVGKNDRRVGTEIDRRRRRNARPLIGARAVDDVAAR